MGAAESYPQPPRSPSEERKREMARRAEEMVGHCECQSVPAVLGLLQIYSDQSSKDDFSKPWISFKEPRDLATGKMQQCSSDDLGLSQPSVKMGAAESNPEPPRSLSEERKRELERREEEIDRRETEWRRELKRRERELMREMARREEEMARTKREQRIELMREMARREEEMARTKREERRELMREMARRKEEMVGHCERQSVPAVLDLSQIHSDQSPEDDFSKPWISFKEPRDLATGKMQQCNSDDLGLSQPSVKMGAAESHPEQDPRYLEMQRELQRRNEELDIRERELRREMDRREQEIDRRERELKRKEEEIDRRESELMREMARREEEMVGHCERKSVPAVLDLSQIRSDESPEDDFSEPWISFKELRINLEKDEEAEEMCGRQWMTSHPEPPRSPSEERKRELERRERELMREMARRKEEMVGHCERQSVPAVLGLSQIHSDESPEDDFSDPWIFVNPVRRNSKELPPPNMSESEDNPLDGL